MAYREVAPSMPLRLALYYAVEGKFFGERASGVGTRTDVYIMRAGQPVFRVKEQVLEDTIFKLCQILELRGLNESHIKDLDSVPGTYIRWVSPLERVKEKDGKVWSCGQCRGPEAFGKLPSAAVDACRELSSVTCIRAPGQLP